MFKNLLRPDSPLMIVMTQITDCIFLSMFFFLGCLPVLTIGASFAALYDSVFRGFRDGEKHTWQRFLHSFRQNWKSGILPTIFFLLAMAGMAYGGIQLWNHAVYGNISWALFAGMMLVLVVAVGALSVLFPMLSRFENSLGALLRNTFVLALANLPRTLVLGILNVAAGALCIGLIAPIFLVPALAALIGTWLIEPMFRPYMPEKEEEDEEIFEEAAE